MLRGGSFLGPITGRTQQIRAKVGLASKDFNDFRSIIDNMSSILLRMRSGAAVTPEEYDRIKGFIPVITEDEKTIKNKIERFNSEIEYARQNYIKRATQTSFEIYKENLKQNPLSDTSDKIKVKDKKTGKTGILPANEFDPALYIKL